jgi:ketosteroid isomerase-like protein
VKGEGDIMTAAQAEKELRAITDEWLKALRAKDVDGLMRHYAPDVLTFDIAPPLRVRGADTVRGNWAVWLKTFDGPLNYEMRDLALEVDGSVAFCHSVNRINGKRTDGSVTDVWIRVTVGFRKTGGAWKVVHEHVSTPFYMDGSFKAAVDLKP